MLLKGKRVLVTGGSRGLGRSLCSTFAKEGARVCFSYASDDKGAKEALNELKEDCFDAIAFKASVLDAPALSDMVARIEKAYGGIDILVNNAGVSQVLPMALLEEKDWDLLMDTNAKGTYMVTRTVLKSMLKRRAGRILNISSLAGVKLIESPVHYSASKAAIKGFTEALSKEVARYGITVNCIAPGLLEGGVAANLPDYRLKDYLAHCTMGRLGSFDEVSRAALFMVSDENTYMNGYTLIMDGGL